MNTRENEFTSVLENQQQVEQLEQAAIDKGRQMLDAADEWIRRNPYLAVGVAVAVGCALATLLRRD